MKNLCVSTLLVLFVLSSCVFYDEKTKSDSSRGLELEQVPINKIDMTCEEFYDLEKKIIHIVEQRKKIYEAIDLNYVNTYKEKNNSKLCTVIIAGEYRKNNKTSINNDEIKNIITDIIYQISKLDLNGIDKIYFLIDDFYNNKTSLYTYKSTSRGLILTEIKQY